MRLSMTYSNHGQELANSVHQWYPRFIYINSFIMFSVITNIYNKKTKGPTLMEQAQENWKSISLTTRDVRCMHHGWHGTHRNVIQVLATYASTRVHRYSSLLQSSTQACGFSDPHVLTLRRFTAPLTWNVASSLSCTLSSKWSSELIKSRNCKQKSRRRLWSSSDNCCTI